MGGGTGGYLGEEKKARKDLDKGLLKILNSKVLINSELKLIAYDEDGFGLENSAMIKMTRYLHNESGLDDEKIMDLNEKTKYLINFPRLRGFFMENFGGYKKI